MKKATKLSLAGILAFAIGLTGCGGGGTKNTTTPSQPPQQTPTLLSLSVSPTDHSVPLGRTQQMKATGTYSDNSSKELTSTVTWKSSDETIASISNAGLLTTLKKGSVTVTATSGTVTKSTAVNVTDPVLASIVVLPAEISLASGQTQQLSAYGIYSDNSQRDISSLVTWSSGDATLVDVSVTGLAVAKKQGATKITASLSGISGNVDLTISAAVLTQVDVTPELVSIPTGADQQLVATGTFSDGSTQDLVNVQWSSGDTAIATVTSSGIVKGVGAGTVTITAKVGDLTDSMDLTVTPATLVSLAITPSAPSLAKGTSQQFTAIGTFTDGSTQDITSSVTWTSETPAVATVDTLGFVKTLAEGSTVISASSGDTSGSATLVVTSAVIASINVTPADSSIGIGGTVQFAATGVFTDATTQDLTTQVTWISSDASIATINSTGLANTVGKGTANISAVYGSVTGSTLLTVTDATLTTITIAPDNPLVAVHTKLRFTATGQFSDGSTRVLSGVAWNSSKPKFASINGSGLLRSKRVGSAVIKATLNGKTGTTTVTITNSPITSVVVSPATASISAGEKQQFTATGYFADSGLPAQDLSASVYWRTSDYNTATISSSGLATGVRAGTVNITATYGDLVSVPAVLTVN
ncbi:MAG TPA: Ig-like domain-containing protein [Terriglobales bacterium]|nr:Ig-like domain-containing protein [Terriglobales bacterium]